MKASCVLLTALALGGCCLSGSGCNVPQPLAGIELNGADQLAEDDALSVRPAPPQRSSRGNRVKAEQPLAASDNLSVGSRETEEAQEQADESRLKRKLIICQNCGAAPPPSGEDRTTR